MAGLMFSRDTAAAFAAMEKYTRKDNREARRLIHQVLAGKPKPRDYSVAARIYAEDWRNGWHDGYEDKRSPLGNAKNFSKQARQLAPQDWYVQWKLAYAKKYRARTKGWGEMAEAEEAYGRAIGLLESQYGLPEGGDKTARENYLDVLIDRAESWVYQGAPDRAAGEIARTIAHYKDETDPTKKPDLEDWYYWAYAFALHQQGRYLEACLTLEPLFGSGRKPNNDIHLLLATSYARCGKMQQARDTIATFHKNRKPKPGDLPIDVEPHWTAQIELACGAFLEGTPEEAHWLESLRMILDEGKPHGPGDRPKTKRGRAKPGAAKTGPGRKAARKAPARRKARPKARGPKKPPARKKAAKKRAARRRR